MEWLSTPTAAQGGFKMSAHFIGQPGSPAVELFRKHGLTPLRGMLPPELFAAVWPRPAHPNAVLLPPVVFWLMAVAVLGDGAMCGAVLSFWSSLSSVCPSVRLKSVTEESFCMARRALSVRFFRALFVAFVQRQEQAQRGRWLWHGKRLLAFDGTLVTLAPAGALRKSHPPASNQRGACKRPQALLVGLVGLSSGLCHQFMFVPQKQSEQWCACWLTRYLCPGDLVLGDCNFGCYEVAARTVCRGADFVFRLSAKRFQKLSRHSTNSGRNDEWLVELKLPAELRERCPQLPAVFAARLIEYQIPGYRKSWLLTSLTDARKYPRAEIVGLYHQRWNQETMHREWKHTLQLSNLRSHSAQGVCKEVFVQLTLNNAIRAMQAEALSFESKPIGLRFRDTKRLVVAQIPVMADAPVEDLPSIYSRLLGEIARLRVRFRPGRWYPRPQDGKPRNKGHGRFVQPARFAMIAHIPTCHV
jgi:hypothetical protein